MTFTQNISRLLNMGDPQFIEALNRKTSPLTPSFKSVRASLYPKICLLTLVGDVGKPHTYLHRASEVSRIWLIHEEFIKLARYIFFFFACLNPVADLLFWSLFAWQCVSLTGLFQQASLMWECRTRQRERDTGEWRSIGVEINDYHVRQMLAPLTSRVRTIGKDS